MTVTSVVRVEPAFPPNSLARQMVAGVLVLNFVVAGIICFSLYQSKLHYSTRAIVATQNISQILDEYITGIIAKVDIDIQSVSDEAERQLATGAIRDSTLNSFIIREHSRLPELVAFRATNESGDAIYGPEATPAKTTSLAHRDYFKSLRDTPDAGLLISKPIVGGISGKWMVILARRINKPDGTFAGLVYAGVELAYLTKTFSKIDVGTHGVITFVDSDFGLVARFPQYKSAGMDVGQRVNSHRFSELIQAGKTTGMYTSKSSIDSIERTFSFRKLNLPSPHYVIVGLATSDYLAGWHKEIMMLSLFMLIVILITFASASMFYREWKRTRDAEEALASSERFLKAIIDAEPECIKMLDIDGNLLMMNRAGLEIIEADSFEQVKDQCVYPLITDQHRDAFMALTKQTFHGIPGILEFEIIGIKGQHAWLETHVVPFRNEQGNIVALLGIGRDVSERIRLEKEREAFNHKLQQTQKLESLGVLAGGIAHDFNNILMTIMGNADLALLRINKESPATENLLQIEQAAARAADLARQMLAYSGKGKFVVEDLDINNLVEDMLHMLEVSISKKSVLRRNLHLDLPAVKADATQIRQIIMNLIINASEAIGNRSGVITLTTGCMDCDRNYLKDVWLDGNLSDGLYVYLEIADTGCGMDKEVMAKLFDPFFTTKFTGRGLGMAAVLGIVRGHKGAIKVYSEPDKGTTFKILLPSSGRVADILAGETHKDDWRGGGKVLLVDDEETIRGVGTEMLKEFGFTIITANDGKEAIEIFKTTSDISFVILDLTMPHMDGEQCFSELRQLDSGVKVIMSSGFSEHEITRKFAGKGLAGFIQKPYTLSVLKDAIRNIQ